MKKILLTLLLTLFLVAQGAASPLQSMLRIAELPDFSAHRSMASGMVAAASDPMFCYEGWEVISQGTGGPFTVTFYRCPTTGTEISCSSYMGGQEFCYCVFMCAD